MTLAGLGTAAIRGHLPALARFESLGLLTLAAAADPAPDRREAIRGSFPELKTYASAEAMLEAVDSDLLVVATDPPSHGELVTLGFRQGRNVVCEKPLTLSREQHRAVLAVCAARPAQALVPVHQYSHADAWGAMAPCARSARRLGLPFSLAVDVQRDGTDKRAVSAWRNARSSGGMLADHAVHFLALAWSVAGRLDVVEARREWDDRGRERSSARVRIGSGLLAFRGSAAASAASTRCDLRVGPMTLSWVDGTLSLLLAGRSTHTRRVVAISDRSGTDSLYAAFYRTLVERLGDVGWRSRKTREALDVGAALVELLEDADAHLAPEPSLTPGGGADAPE